jgi:hypothetical protein
VQELEHLELTDTSLEHRPQRACIQVTYMQTSRDAVAIFAERIGLHLRSEQWKATTHRLYNSRATHGAVKRPRD